MIGFQTFTLLIVLGLPVLMLVAGVWLVVFLRNRSRSSTVEARLERIDALFASRKITEQERDRQRANILSGV